MEMLSCTSYEDIQTLPKTKWNIAQPESKCLDKMKTTWTLSNGSLGSEGRVKALDDGGLDLILVPGLGFSEVCKRLVALL